MSFNIALSGLSGASKELEATGNNIANASTVGFKKSRVEFGDLYSGGFLSAGANSTGGGVRVQDVRQLHAQGNVTATDNGLDMAINGEGFFVLNNGGEVRYSRAGQFGLSQDGFLQNNQGMRVQGYQGNENGNLSGILGDLQIETGNLPPQTTSNVNAAFNLNSGSVAPDTTQNPFDPADEASFNYESSTRIYDSLGNPHSLTQFFVKNPTDPMDPTTSNSWNLYVRADDTLLNGGAPYSLQFNSNGSFNAATSDPVDIVGWQPRDSSGAANGASVADFTIDLSRSTQFGQPNGVNDLRQNGYSTGRLTGLDVSDGGDLFGRYSNGQAGVLGQVALANFRNAEGLSPVGETTWVESMNSGGAVIGQPGTGTLGSIKAGSIEESNVDLSQQLVALIIAQRNFQANAKTIETSDAITQTIINIR